MAKQISFNGNTINNTSEIIANENFDLNGLKPGTRIKKSNDNTFYSIVKTEETMVIRDFEKTESNKIKIKNLHDNLFLKNDELFISFKTYEATTVSIISCDDGFSENELIALDGGTLHVSRFDNTKNPTILKVEKTDANGKATRLSFVSRGSYTQLPRNQTINVNGKNITLHVSFATIDSRETTDAVVMNVENSGTDTYLTLASPLPESLKRGKFSITKNILKINHIFDRNENNISFEIYPDSSPILGIPTIPNNCPAIAQLVNQGFLTLELKIKELEDEIKKLKG